MPPIRNLGPLLLAGILFIGTGIGLRDPWPSDEPRFALIAKEMVESGQWFFPTRGGELYPDKPPLFMWSQALVYRVTGSIRVAALLPSLLSGLLVLLLVHQLARRLWGDRAALLVGVLLLATPQFVLESRAGQLDAMVMAWIALAMYGFLRHLLLGPDRRWLYAGFAACGFGIITKGVGFLPLLAFIPALVWALRARALPRAGPAMRDALVGLGLLLLAIAVWLVPMLLLVEQSGDPAYAAYRNNLLFKQTGERYLTPSHHLKPWWYFAVDVIPALWLPVFLLLPWLVPRWWRAWRANDRAQIILVGWVVLVVAFFSLSPGKRGVYILPALPWICLAAAPYLEEILARPSVRRLAAGVSLLFAGLLLAGAVYLTWIEPDKASELLARYDVDPAGALWLAGIGALAWLIVVGGVRRQPPLAFAGVMLTLWLVLGLWIYPRLDGTKSGRTLMLEVESSLAQDRPLALLDWKEQNLLQARRSAANFGFLVPLRAQAAQALAWLEDHPDGAILVQGRSLQPCFTAGEPVELGTAHRREWYLVDQSNVVADCLELPFPELEPGEHKDIRFSRERPRPDPAAPRD